MHLFSRLAGASLLGAAAANAFLVTPDLSDKALEDPASTNLFTSRQTIKLRCQDCSVALDSPEGVSALDYEPTSAKLRMALEMNLSVDDGKVLLNKAQIYPPFQGTGLLPFFSAKQLVCGKTSDGRSIHRGDLPISTSIDIPPSEEMAGPNGNVKVHTANIEILGVADKPVHVPTMHIKFAELQTGKLILLPVQTTAYEHDSEADQCQTTFCRVRVAVAAKIKAVKAAAIARLARLRGGDLDVDTKTGDTLSERPFRLHGGVGKFKGHPMGKKHHRCNRFRRFARRFVHRFVLPILFGVATGMLVGATAMLCWTIVSTLVVRLCGKKKSASEYTEAEAEEGLDSRGLPPKYEEVYVEPEEDVTDEKKPLM